MGLVNRPCRFLTLAAALSIMVPIAPAQSQNNDNQNSSRPPTTGPSKPTTPLPPGQQPGQQQPTMPQQPGMPSREPQMGPMPTPIFLQGKVILDDGTPAPPNVVIERVCNGQPLPEGYTDSKGHFSFQVGKNTAMIADASVSSMSMGRGGGMNPGFGSPGGFGSFDGVSERQMMGCELRASLAGYRSSTIDLSGHRALDNPNVGVIILKRMANVKGFTISMTSLRAPKKAKKALKKGLKAASKKKWDKARMQFEKAVAEYPEYAEAWCALGQVYEVQKHPDEARQAYQKAIGADTKYMNPHLRIARMDVHSGKWKQAAETTNHILKLNPYDFPDAYFYNSLANLQLRNVAAAEKSAREAIKLKADRRYPQLEQILGISLAVQSHYEEAAIHLQRYLELAPNAPNVDLVKQQLARLKSTIAQQTPAPRQ